MENTTDSLLSEIEMALSSEKVTDETAGNYLDRCLDYLLTFGHRITNETKETVQKHLLVMEKLIGFLDADSNLIPYYRSILAFVKGDFELYLTETKKFFQMKSEKPDWLDWYNAQLYFIEITDGCPSFAKITDTTYRQIIIALRSNAEEYFPTSAFDLYCDFMLASSDTPNYRINLLNKVLEKDPAWSMAWFHIGDINYDMKNWADALSAYENALKETELGRYKTADLFFYIALSADHAKKLDTAMQYYLKCIEIDKTYPYAQNNLAWCYIQKKKYAEAEPYLRNALEYVEDKNEKRYVSRNLFEVLRKLKKNEELYALVQTYPEFFKTKYHQEQIQKYFSKEKGEDFDMEDLETLLQKPTEKESAGKILVSPDQSSIQLYNHQREAIQKLNAWKKQSDRGAGLLVLPTGGGKTMTATYWLMQNILDEGGKVLWVAHRHELLNQALESFKRVCYSDLSPHKSEYKYRVISGYDKHDRAVHIRQDDDILIASKGSLVRNPSYIENWIGENRNHICMIIDEAHHAPASEYRKLIVELETYGGDSRLLGLTATPFRTAEKEQGLLKKLFPDDILYKVDLRRLIEQGILAEPIFHPIQTNISMDEFFHAEGADDLLERIIHEHNFDLDTPGNLGQEAARLIASHSERNRAIVDTYVNNQALYGKTLVFAVNQDMAIALNKLFNERGIRSDFVISGVSDAMTGASRSPEENAKKLQRFRNGELDVLVNVNIVTEGTDLPNVQTVFLTRPTKSTILMTQMIGRALRGKKAGGTEKAYVVSFIDDWQEHIAWVNPEKLFIDSNADFEDMNPETRRNIIRLISIAKIEEFAKLANDSLDNDYQDRFTFLERVPVGIYQFSYLEEDDSTEESDSRNCTVLVYDCMQEAYQELIDWMKSADLSNLDSATDHIDQMLFGEKDRQLGYHKKDVHDILAYYRQTGVEPLWIPLEERAEYDVASVAKHIYETDLSKSEEKQYLQEEWEREDKNGSKKWSVFFGIDNFKAFRKVVGQEYDRLDYPEDYQSPKSLPITEKEQIQIQELSLWEIREKFPESGLYEKLRDAVYEKCCDEEGYYVSKSGFRSKRRLDFQIDHITSMARGGLTTLDNLQLLTRRENAVKSDHWQE